MGACDIRGRQLNAGDLVFYNGTYAIITGESSGFIVNTDYQGVDTVIEREINCAVFSLTGLLTDDEVNIKNHMHELYTVHMKRKREIENRLNNEKAQKRAKAESLSKKLQVGDLFSFTNTWGTYLYLGLVDFVDTNEKSFHGHGYVQIKMDYLKEANLSKIDLQDDELLAKLLYTPVSYSENASVSFKYTFSPQTFKCYKNPIKSCKKLYGHVDLVNGNEFRLFYINNIEKDKSTWKRSWNREFDAHKLTFPIKLL